MMWRHSSSSSSKWVFLCLLFCILFNTRCVDGDHFLGKREASVSLSSKKGIISFRCLRIQFWLKKSIAKAFYVLTGDGLRATSSLFLSSVSSSTSDYKFSPRRDLSSKASHHAKNPTSLPTLLPPSQFVPSTQKPSTLSRILIESGGLTTKAATIGSPKQPNSLIFGNPSPAPANSPLSAPSYSVLQQLPPAAVPQPSSGCCILDMIPRPGLPQHSCTCVYPIRIELFVYNVSLTFVNWSAELQQELSSQLHLSTIQFEITSFHLNGSTLALFINIGPTKSESFTLSEANLIKRDLQNHNVHLNRSLFGNYTLESFRYFEPRDSPPAMGLPPLPLSNLHPQEEVSAAKREGNNLRIYFFVTAVAAVLAALVVLISCIWMHVRSKHKSTRVPIEGILSGRERERERELSNISDDKSTPWPSSTKFLTYEELSEATNDFDPESVLGEGGFGRVYKGVLQDGTAVAIKKLTGGGHQGNREFLAEVEMLSRLHHRNLVKLVGFHSSSDSLEHLLCYELIPNGSLESWLHGSLGAQHPLDWFTRVKIALDAARGLAYLHEDSQPCVIHRDFKASNILLDNEFNAKVADFGLARLAPEGQADYVSTRVIGTFGYVAPEYAMTGHLLVKSDVYSYGVVLLELLSGRKAVDMTRTPGQENLVTRARPILRDPERVDELADARLDGKYPESEFALVAAIALACVASEAVQRPTMGQVLQSLRSLVAQSEERQSLSDVTTLASPSLSHSWKMARRPSRTLPFESDGTSSVFSSGPLSLTEPDSNDLLGKTQAFSEDLHEGR